MSLAKKLKVEVILISESMNSEIKITSSLFVEVILISEFINSEIRMTSPYRFLLPGFHFEKPLIAPIVYSKNKFKSDVHFIVMHFCVSALMITAYLINRFGRITTLVVQYMFCLICMFAAVPLFGIPGKVLFCFNTKDRHSMMSLNLIL